MIEIKKQYDPVILDNIKRMLESENSRGKSRYFDIWADGLKVIEKTNDPERFDAHEEYLNDITERVIINIYTASPTSAHIQTRYTLSFKEETKQQPQIQTQAMNGFSLGEVEARIQEKVSHERERWDCDQVKRDLEATKDKLKESEEYAEKLEDRLDKAQEDAKNAKTVGDFTSILKDLAAPLLLGNKTVSQALSGNDKPEDEASFKMKSGENSLSEQEKSFIEFGKSINQNFSQDEFTMVLAIIDTLKTDKKNIPTVCSLLNINTNQQTNQNGKV